VSFFSFQGQPGAIAIAVSINLLVVGLLISCKVRDAY
jgi:predicted signal transduction protein with EAL and GGDEF domain